MRRVIEIVGTVGGLGYAVLAGLGKLSNFLGILGLPEEIKHALSMMAGAPIILPIVALAIGLFCAGYLIVDSGHHTAALAVFKKRNLRVEPSYLIILGLVIAAVGAGWQIYRGPAQAKISQQQIDQITAPLKMEIKNLQDALTKSKVAAPNIPRANSNATVSSVSIPKKYTTYEKEQRLRAVDEIYNVIATQLQPTYRDGQRLLDALYKGAIYADAEQRLTDYRNRVQVAFDNLNSLLKKYDYFPDIVQVTRKNVFNDVEATHGVGNLVPEFQALRQKAPNDIHWFLLRDNTMDLARNQMRKFEQYLSDTTKGLQEKRAEIEKSEVYSGQ